MVKFLSFLMIWWFSVGLSAPALAEESGKLGFVIRDWFISVYNSKFLDECPNGLAISNNEIWYRRLSKEVLNEYTRGGQTALRGLARYARRRGPKNEEVCFWPDVVKDPPMKVIEGKYAYGANLDGTLDGRATPKSCAHQKFTGLDGSPGIDNQLYRLAGCNYGWLVGGLVDFTAHEMRGTSGLGIVLIEVTGVTDPRNSDNVTVTFYRSVDQFAFDGSGKPLPFSSYRIHTHSDGTPVYGDSLKGSIKDGVLTTERGSVLLPFYGHYNFMSNVIRDMALTLEIAPNGETAKGMITGYYNLDDYVYYEGGMSGHLSAGDSCPAFNDMAYKMADGYPDPETGVCTHISSAFDVGAYAAFVIHPGNEEEKEERTALR